MTLVSIRPYLMSLLTKEFSMIPSRLPPNFFPLLKFPPQNEDFHAALHAEGVTPQQEASMEAPPFDRKVTCLIQPYRDLPGSGPVFFSPRLRKAALPRPVPTAVFFSFKVLDSPFSDVPRAFPLLLLPTPIPRPPVRPRAAVVRPGALLPALFRAYS